MSLGAPALFPAASSIKRGVTAAVNPTFISSISDAHLLFEVKEQTFELLWVKSKHWQCNYEQLLLFLSLNTDTDVWHTVWIQWSVFGHRCWTSFPSKDKKPGFHLRRDHPEKANRHIEAHIRSFKSYWLPASARFWAHCLDFGVHCPSDGQLRYWIPKRRVGRVLCKPIQIHQEGSDTEELSKQWCCDTMTHCLICTQMKSWSVGACSWMADRSWWKCPVSKCQHEFVKCTERK